LIGFGASSFTTVAICLVSDGRRVETVRASFGIGDQPRNRRLEIGLTDQEALAASHQHDIFACSIDSGACGADPLDGECHLVEWRGCAARRVLDRQSGDAGRDARVTFAATPAGSSAKPPSKSAFTGRSVTSFRVFKCASTLSHVTLLSGWPIDHASPNSSTPEP
jgi:hypothetical protein